MWFWPANEIIELVLYLFCFNFTCPWRVFAYPVLNTTDLVINSPVSPPSLVQVIQRLISCHLLSRSSGHPQSTTESYTESSPPLAWFRCGHPKVTLVCQRCTVRRTRASVFPDAGRYLVAANNKVIPTSRHLSRDSLTWPYTWQVSSSVPLPVTVVLSRILQAAFPMSHPNVLTYLGLLQEVGGIMLLEQKRNVQGRPW